MIPGVPVVFGGKQRMLRFDHKAIGLLEAHHLGQAAIAAVFRDKPISTLRCMLWAGLGATDTEDQIGQWMDECEDLRAVNLAVWQAFTDSLQSFLKRLGIEENGTNPPPAEATTGPTPCASPAVRVN